MIDSTRRLLIIFGNSLDPDQARQDVGPDLDLNCLDTDCTPERTFRKGLILKESADNQQPSQKVWTQIRLSKL